MTANAIRLFGADWCPDCARIKHFFGQHRVEYQWIDIDRDQAAAAELLKLNSGNRTVPTLMFADGTILAEPTNRELAEKLNLSDESAADYCDVLIAGAGPAGMAAAIYTTRENLKTVLIERSIVGGQASLTDQIDNYPGFPEGVKGMELSQSMEKQARRFGADIRTGVAVERIEIEGKYKKVITSAGNIYVKSILIATGSDYRTLGVPGEKEFTSRGVHYCATCDGPLYSGKELIVVGGGNSAMQESVFLTRFASKITILVRGIELKGTELLINKIKSMPQIEVHFGVTTTGISQSEAGRMLLEANSSRGGRAKFIADGIFVFIGLVPNTTWLKGQFDLDDQGFIKTSKTFETSMPGVFAAGDVRSGSTLQLASAVGEGVTAALMIREYLKEE
jgi:thioredoxin reductase (NADPH)